MVYVYILIYLKSVLRYSFVIFDTYYRTVFLCEQGCSDPWLFLEAKKGSANRKVWEHSCRRLLDTYPGMEQFVYLVCST